MSGANKKLTNAVEQYFTDLRRIRASGGATGERSSYPALSKLLDAVGATLRPKVFCVADMADQGAGHPDFGLYSQRQLQRGVPRKGQAPERGVVEVKSPGDDMQETFREQVARYGERYRLVLATNQREFRLTAVEAGGVTSTLESFGLAGTEAAFAHKLEHPRAFARESGAGLGEYLSRALSHRATLVDPKDVAWLLASYARDGLARVEAAGDPPSLRGLRSALEEALGVRFEGARGTRFFHSTLVQTLFYGIFSAWVLWSRHEGSAVARSGSEGGPVRFSWREAVWHLRAPVLRALFQQVADPGRLQRLNLVEVLDWTAAALDRVDRTAFFSRFNEGEAVPYFYEPFLQAFDPELRKQLGVWYTPTEVVRYMVARVDKALKDDLGIADGLAAENVYVLDPCCGTGAYLAEVLRRIAVNLEGQGFGALTGARVKQAATERVFGFEIMPAPFVVAHLQVGLTMQDLDAALADDGAERAGIFLTNALTGWEPHTSKPLPFPELEEERDRAEQVKQEKPILVILGNPPYNGFAGMAVDEERELSVAYRKTRRVRRPEGQGLNDLYVRFFRMAERRIAQKTGQGVICFISNYSWLDGLSFTGMRERYLEAFDEIRIDCLNGDRYKTGKVAPDGSPDPSIFSTEGDPVGIQVGTAVTTLVRKPEHAPATDVAFRHLWGRAKRTELTATAETEPSALYEGVGPILPLGLPFSPVAVSSDWFNWPRLPDLLPTAFPGVQTGRDAFLVDIDLDRLKSRVADYFDAGIGDEEIARRYPRVMETTARFDARTVRNALLERGGPDTSAFIRIAYRPFDNRWLYWEKDTKLLDEKRADYRPQVFEGNPWLSVAQHLRKGAAEPQSVFTEDMGSRHLIERGTLMFPAWLRDDGLGLDVNGSRRANLSPKAKRYLDQVGAGVDDLFHHVLAVLHDPGYRAENAGALRMEWPRIPLPGWPDGEAECAADAFAESAERGRRLAALLHSEVPVAGVTQGTLSPAMAAIAVPATTDGRNMASEDFTVTVGWGHFGAGKAVMPGQGRVVERPFSPAEGEEMGASLPALGESTLDVYLNARALWRNVPAAVWNYKLGGYQVLKKWLSYRESGVLGRSLRIEEIQHFTATARRIATILRLTSGTCARSV
ncbi:type ISP restriction/modification enzyme [Candidatus Palauibacter sp.]|uniref:type ISP restriction/modification enzyme n=1 Tax=Candidatus Palauibacter sp. TaxID=3101350 RepID=UPI003C7028AE